jgi:RNA polymerase sigma-70 factor (ECF subfamily)
VQESRLDALRRRDPVAFEHLVRSNVVGLRAVARRLLSDDSEADDVVQEAFIAAFEKLPDFRGDSKVETWLHRVVVNAALMRLRKRRPVSTGDVEALMPKFTDAGHITQLSARWSEPEALERWAERAETRGHVRRIIDSLPQAYRTVLVLRDIEELSTREAAQMLGISEGAVKTRLHRARFALKARMEQELGPDVARTQE